MLLQQVPTVNRRSSSLDISAALLLTVIAAAGYVALRVVPYRQMIFVLLVAAGLVVTLAGSKAVRWGFGLWVCTFAIGYRTIAVTSELRVHPAELGLVGLVSLLVVPATQGRAHLTFWLPKWVWFFLPFWFWAWVPAIRAERPLDLVFSEFRNFLLLIPLFFVALYVLRRPEHWRPVLLIFFAVATYIAALGVLEYVFPGARSMFPGWMSRPEAFVTVEGFARANFSFWGGPQASFICALAAPLAIVARQWWPGPWQRAVTLLAVVLQVAAIYIGGYRSLWFLLGVQFLLFLSMRRQYVAAPLVLLLIAIGYQKLPEPTQQRAYSLVRALQGKVIDTSVATRSERAKDAVNMSLDHPLGAGWAAAGWVHSDFLQVAANLGVPAGLLFAGAFVYTWLRLFRGVRGRRRIKDETELRIALLISFTGVGGLLAMEGVGVLPQLVLPVWFIWVIIEVFLRQASLRKRIADSAPRNLSSPAYLQLRG